MPNSSWTETGASLDLVPSTTSVAVPGNVNYLTNADKIILMAEYAAELATKTQLDTLAATWSVSPTAYDTAVGNISSGLITAGAPSNWATIWPDGTTSGPWSGIQTNLGNLWSVVATQRTALLSGISNAQAAVAQSNAIAAAATTSLAQMNAAVTVAQNLAPMVVATLPALPNTTVYPVGKVVWNTADNKLYQNVANVWTLLVVAGANLQAGTVTAAQMAANTITAGQIAAGAIGASQIAAGAITTSSLTVANFDNLVPNPNSAQLTPQGTAWPTGSYEAVGLGVFGGTNGSIFNPPANGYSRICYGNSSTQNGFAVSGLIPCQPGDQFFYQCYAVNLAGAFCHIALQFYDGNGAGATPSWSGTTGGGLLTVQATAPASVSTSLPAAFVQAWVFVLAGSGSYPNQGLFNFFYLRRMLDSNIIVDGTVTASKIAAGAISASVITTGTLNASLVSVTNLNASNISTGTLSAAKVLFADGSALTTASRVLTSVASISGSTSTSYGSGGAAWIRTPLGFTVTAESTADTFNIYLNLVLGAYASNYGVTAGILVDSLTYASYYGTFYLPYAASTSDVGTVPIFYSFTGLSAGSHTLTFGFYIGTPSISLYPSSWGTSALCQRIY